MPLGKWNTGREALQIVPSGGPSGGFHEVRYGGSAGSAGSDVWRDVVIATGVEPFVPPLLAGALTLANWEDARRLRSELTPGRHLAIIGGGWIGLELASSASRAGLRVTVIELGGRPLPLLPTEVSDRVGEWLGESGVEFVPAGVEALRGHEVVTSGGVIRADVVVAALGSRPRTGWLPVEWRTPTGHLPVDRAGHVVVDDGAPVPGAWAIGDVAAVDGVPHQHWNAAVAAAERCAAALTGEEPGRVPAPHVFSTMFGRDLDLVGWPQRDLAIAWRGGDSSGDSWTALMHGRDGRTHAGLVVGRPRDVADLKKLLANGPAAVDAREAAVAPRLRPLRR